METMITVKQAYVAMFEYWAGVYKRTGSGEIGSALSELSLLEDGSSADPAAIEDWLEIVEKVVRGDGDANMKFID
ncbi:hypothetical protein MUG10_09615 [Xanthomonas prunicola]|uniref:Uncharacterized protein n=1 Tax=Xanthomonas prunicola TaxID=2053930 RepID=A0A9Q9J6Z9_9XANT|nr:hypothetical protein [Xanthomonas prunicola]USJ02324.1 hypothetical protein MUG10_09615 [Xanthomonas prunicola]UXA50837.1 hypothetical protein M0D44_10345 [Xanthomonas prunicola]UXA59144.1 hypothetical protein M0D47_10380 [Xanthomonas prunicola]UXA61285.1 hypothetical protein M0D48_20675 [Xanthomonas prunicola]UXA67353.1 hypothetical protein M0D43_10610 [Xanthomonas prunicola]